MNLRPRCRDWLPLCTQQMRLRNLARIQGLNIECEESGNALIYYTLHHDKESVALYTSEALPQRFLQQKWAEIDAAGDELRKSNSNCVCVKVWACWKDCRKAVSIEQETEPKQIAVVTDSGSQNKEPQSVLTKQLANVCLTPNKLPRPPDRLLFTWAVYFSGLMPLSEQPDTKWQSNTLIFLINGEYFSSPEYFTKASLRDQLSLNYQRYSESVPKDSPPKRDEYSINSPSVSRSSSPVSMDKECDLLQMSTTRYNVLNCSVNNVRNSYDLKQLLKIQELQRLHQQKLRESEEISTDIRHLSVHCITRAELRGKPRTTSVSTSSATNHHLHHSMGRTLSVLLSEQQKVEPLTLYTAQQLQIQLETLRTKRSLLQAARETYAKRIAKQKKCLEVLKDTRSQLENMLSQRKDEVESERLKCVRLEAENKTLKQHKCQLIQQVERRMTTLCIELREIYYIAWHHTGLYSICGIRIPNLEAYVYDARYAANNSNLENPSPLALSAALGYIAHLVKMIAIIFDKPLRNPIIYETSRSRILDIIKELPYASREFPLYTRSAMLSKPVKYAIYLLNQNIAQLCFEITGTRCDLRFTFQNLLHIFNVLSQKDQNQRADEQYQHDHQMALPSQRSELTVDVEAEVTTNRSEGEEKEQQQQQRTSIIINNGSSNDLENFTNSHSSVDINDVPVPVPNDLPSSFLQLLSPSHVGSEVHALDIAGSSLVQRSCRSVGSYSDCEDDFKNINDRHKYSNSDSNIPFQSEHS